MQLRYYPYGIFHNSKSPAGLYARQKWLGESENPTWKKDFEKEVYALVERLRSSDPESDCGELSPTSTLFLDYT